MQAQKLCTCTQNHSFTSVGMCVPACKLSSCCTGALEHGISVGSMYVSEYKTYSYRMPALVFRVSSDVFLDLE